MVQRIVSSAHFVKAPQLRDILVYLTRRALEDNATAISEHEVGCNVLGRRADFNPNEDNIVRVQVRHLRKKLEDFFDTEGRDEPVVLTIPKGSYVPCFSPRPQPLPAPPASAETPAIDPSHPAAGPNGPAVSSMPVNRWIRPAAAGLVLLCLVLSAVALRFGKEAEELRARVPGFEDRIPASEDVLWSEIFAPGQRTTIVVADTCLVMVQDILGVDAPLRDLAGGSATAKIIDGVQDKELQSALRLIASRQYTSLGDVNVTTNLLSLSEHYNARPRIRYARYLDTREFKSGNFILIGSRRGVPWVQLFEPQLNFYIEQDAKTHSFRFLNRSPQPGEQPYYGNNSDTKNQEESYADIAILPNLSGSGYVVIISGITMEATEAAGELVASKDFSSTLAKLLRAGSGNAPARYAELLMQARTMPGTAGVSRIICHRLVRPSKTEP
jgi:hypothetical protein